MSESAARAARLTGMKRMKVSAEERRMGAKLRAAARAEDAAYVAPGRPVHAFRADAVDACLVAYKAMHEGGHTDWRVDQAYLEVEATLSVEERSAFERRQVEWLRSEKKV